MAIKKSTFIPGLKKAIDEYQRAKPAEPILPRGARPVPREGIPQGPMKRTVPPLKTIPMPNYPRFPKIQPRPGRPTPRRPAPRRPPKKRMLIA